jgi:hypothetical protein
MKTSDEYSGLDECGSGDGCLGRSRLSTRAKTPARETRAHGSAKISGKALGVQQKMDSKELKNGLSSLAMGIMKTTAGGIQSPVAKPTHYRH